MLNKANKQWSAKRLITEIEKNNINFDCAVQRGYSWDVDRESLLIHSMIEDFPIPAFYFAKKEDDKHDALDGKQRSHAIHRFMTDSFALSEVVPSITLDDGTEMDIDGLKYSDLPNEIQQRIRDYSLTIYYFDGITDDEVVELFYRLNNGKPLTPFELTKVKAKSIATFKEIAKHPAIDFAISEIGKRKTFDIQIAMQMYTICYNERPSFDTKDFRPMIVEAIVTIPQMRQIVEYLDMINELYQQYDPETKEDKKMLKKLKARTHIVSLVYMASLYKEMNLAESFKSVAHRFFDTTSGTSIDDSYNKAAGTRTGSPEKVKIRMDAIKEFLNSRIEVERAS